MEKIFLPGLAKNIKSVLKLEIPVERREILQPLIDYIRKKREKKQEVNLIFICTHNSRRSQLSQIWAKTAAAYYDVDVNVYSGGVEVTEFNSRAVEAIKEAGFSVSTEGKKNPVYSISYSKDQPPVKTFSKVFDDKANSAKEFAAVMNCAEADENCPLIPGAEVRIPVTYEDPKAFDDSPEEREKYEQRSMQIAAEMFYVFRKVGEKGFGT